MHQITSLSALVCVARSFPLCVFVEHCVLDVVCVSPSSGENSLASKMIQEMEYATLSEALTSLLTQKAK